MTLLVQITDTHILPPGELLYNRTDTAAHLGKVIQQINNIRPAPDMVLVTGDLAERTDRDCYRHFLKLIKPLTMPVYVIPGNHDDPVMMREAFKGTPYFPVRDGTCQYAIESLPFRVLALNSKSDGTDLPELDDDRLSWLKDQLGNSDKPVLIAIHHPPMTTGIEFVDMGGDHWFQGLKSMLGNYPQVRLVICGHSHATSSGRIGQVPVYMAGSTSHQLIAARGLNIAPATINAPAAPVLHHFIDGDFLSGSYPWPADVDEKRIDREAGLSWAEMKKGMMGSRA